MKIFNFELESKLDLHFDVKFDGECVGDGSKLHLHFNVKFDDECDADGPES